MIKNNPFYILGVSTYDSKAEILEKAEELEFTGLDSDTISKASSELTHPKNRIKAELDWIYFNNSHELDVDNDIDINTIIRKYTEKIDYKLFQAHLDVYDLFLHDLFSYDDYDYDYEYSFLLTPLSCINILIELLQKKQSNEELEQILFFLSEFFEYVNDTESVLEPINQVRTNDSNFPEYTDEKFVQKYLKEKYGTCIRQLFNNFQKYPFKAIVQIATDFEEHYTTNKFHNDFIDEYRNFTRNQLDKGIEDINKTVEKIESILNIRHNTNISNEINVLIKLIGEWDAIAQPIQLNLRDRGLDDYISGNLSNQLRTLAINLHNKYDQTKESAKLIKALKEYFQELPEMDDLLNKDVQTINQIIETQEVRKREAQENLKKKQENNGCGCLLVIIIIIIVMVLANS